MLLTYMKFPELGNRHHGMLTAATNVFNTLSIGFGINSRMAFERIARQKLGSDLSGIFGLALSITKSSSVGISFLKSRKFSNPKNSSLMVSLGLQSPMNNYLALGALYQEVNDGYFKAPVLEAGVGIRPFGSVLTLGIDARATPKGVNFSDGFRCDPVFKSKNQL